MRENLKAQLVNKKEKELSQKETIIVRNNPD